MPVITRRQLLLSVPAVAVARRVVAQGGAPPIHVRTLSHFGLAVSDTKQSVDFYRNLLGMPIQARAGENTILRVGAGPQFISIGPAGNAAPNINHFCLGVENFNVDRLLAALAAHGVTKGNETAPMKAAVTMREETPDLLFGDTVAAPDRWAMCARSKRRRRRDSSRCAISAT